MSRKRQRSRSPSQDTHHPPAVRTLQALEAELCALDRLGLQAESPCDALEGGRLIRLDTSGHHPSPEDMEKHAVWVDRYDARLLLSPPPASTPPSNLHPQITSPPEQSPTGYSDLPSDHEEMFYFEPEERLEIAQKKLRRRRDDERAARIKLREEEDSLREEQLRLSKLPPAEQITLMERTLDALKGSPSPSLLEIRILANHGNDPRFSSFLRRDGKWRAHWEAMKADPGRSARPRPEPASSAASPGRPAPAAGGLVDYDDSSDENGSDGQVGPEESGGDPPRPTPDSSLPTPSKCPTSPRPAADERASEAVTHALGSSAMAKDDVRSETEPILGLGHAPVGPEPAPRTVDAVERLNRQQRAKLWAEKRRKAGPPLAAHPPPPPVSP